MRSLKTVEIFSQVNPQKLERFAVKTFQFIGDDPPVEDLQVDSLELNAPSKKQISRYRGTLEDFESRFIRQVLDETDWRIGGRDGAAVKLTLLQNEET